MAFVERLNERACQLNMLGFEYDSRTIIGTDVFGGKEPFVVFADRSWISQNGIYNANSGEYTAFENAAEKDDIDLLNNKCTNMFTVSRMILDLRRYSHKRKIKEVINEEKTCNFWHYTYFYCRNRYNELPFGKLCNQ